MKIALIAWNVLLTVGLAYLIFANTKSTATNSNGGLVTPAAADSFQRITVAYVNVDTLEKQYDLFSQKKKEMEQKQKSSEALFNRRMEEFQNDYVNAQQAASTMSQSQLEETSQKLQQKQMELQQLQDKLQADFQQELGAINKELEDSLNSYIEHYNADKHFTYIFSFTSGGPILYGEPALDITKQVVIGMNERLKKAE